MKESVSNSTFAATSSSEKSTAGGGWSQFIRWSGFGGVVGPVLFVLLFTVAGLLRPGYSAVRQTVSDLGVGPFAWLVNMPIVILGLLLIALAIGFYQAMRRVLRPGLRRSCAVLVALPGLGFIAGGVFTEDPSTLIFHILLGATLGLYFPIVTFFVVGLALLVGHRDGEWRWFGLYSLLASAATVAVIVFLQLAFMPGSPLFGFQIAGLAERADLVEILAWYIILGWRLFRLPSLD